MAGPVSNSDAALSAATSALRAQQSRMRVVAENIANSDSVATAPGQDPYQRQVPVFEPFTTPDGGKGVRMAAIRPDPAAFHTEYNPGAPGADSNGYVRTPNVEPLTEAMDLKEAQRAYEANLNVIQTVNAMQTRTLDIIKK